MGWANVTKIRTPPSAKRYSPPPPPPHDEHAPYKDNFATGPGMSRFSPPVAPGNRMPDEILRMPKVIADIAQRGGTVIIIPVSWALNINA